MGIFGDLVKGAMGGFNTIPDAPPAPNVNTSSTLKRLASANAGALPEFENIAGDVNTFNVGQRGQMVRSAIPSFDAITGAESGVLNDWLAGRLSPSLVSQVRRNAASRAFEGGYGGTGFADNLEARDLGLSSLDLQGRGAQLAPGYLNTIAGITLPQQVSPSAFFLSPAQQLNTDQFNEEARYGRDWLQNQLDSIPDPYKAAIASDVGGIADVVGTAALTALGGVGGGAIGGAAGATAGSSLGGKIGGSSSGSSLGLDWLDAFI